MVIKKDKASELVSRISVSLAPALLTELDQMVESRQFGSRSQAVSDMVNRELVEYKRSVGNDIMVGTITVHYDRSVRGLQSKLADIEYQYIDEVISSLHVQLSENQVMEVLLVQGHTQRLQEIANVMLTRRGVFSCRLQVHAAIIPPLQAPVASPRPKRLR
ncbi:CopG family nickel-responsive transcriptional regulator [Actimicrobium sp. GrIS 1.19]|uniref:CopG family ribbon-helix-helix protein n=1 Tax=Actimicrobium sp. GrIS 1.19 TaxID=3071708 RepID=UPI002E0BA345|nr:CopG family nickel-responsive transcriptional regulator [Actimicrobium sp. GrIS 1.19]